MQLLTDQPHMTVSVGHRPKLESSHTRKIELARRSGGTRLVRDIDLTEPSGQLVRRWFRRWSGRAYRPAS
jgi:hypothetical protein